MADDLAALLAKRLISRRDVKARQHPDGAYMPEREPWKMGDLRAHVVGERTYGHYLLDPDDNCKFFAFDLDLVPGWPINGDAKNLEPVLYPPSGPSINPYEVWQRPELDDQKMWLMVQLWSAASELAGLIRDRLAIPVLIAYSGHKGFHVYGLTGPTKAAAARRAGHLIIGRTNTTWYRWRGENFYRNDSFPAISIEVFPKQDSLGGKDLGNLLRLPCGVHQKSRRPGFFVNANSEWDTLEPMDPVLALDGNPWVA